MREFCSVHLHLTNGTVRYHTILAKKRKGELHIVVQNSFDDFGAFSTNNKKGIPIILSFTGSKIIGKKIAKQPNYLDGLLFNQNPDEFYIQEHDLDSQILVSIARREIIDHHLEEFTKQQYQIIDINIGPFILEALGDLVKDTVETLHTSELSYSLTNHSLINTTGDTHIHRAPLTIGDDVIQNETFLAFSGLLSYFNKEGITSNFDTEVVAHKEEATYKKMFNVYGVFCLIAFFSLLLISYLIQDIYGQKSAEIQMELSLKNQQLDEIKGLKEDRDYKLNIIHNSSLGTEHFLSHYISEIGNTVPKDVLLKELGVFPLTRPVRQEESIKILPKLISIQGQTTSRNSINEWVATLQKMKWAHKVELTSYSELKSDYDFTISILL